MVFDTVRAILVDQMDLDEEDITMDSLIAEDLGADSLDIADIIMSIEEEYDLEVSDDQLQNIRTVGDVVRYIEENAE